LVFNSITITIDPNRLIPKRLESFARFDGALDHRHGMLADRTYHLLVRPVDQRARHDQRLEVPRMVVYLRHAFDFETVMPHMQADVVVEVGTQHAEALQRP